MTESLKVPAALCCVSVKGSCQLGDYPNICHPPRNKFHCFMESRQEEKCVIKQFYCDVSLSEINAILNVFNVFAHLIVRNNHKF